MTRVRDITGKVIGIAAIAVCIDQVVFYTEAFLQ